MGSRSELKRLTEEDRFSREFACWAQNHDGWSKAKRANRRAGKKRLRRITNSDLQVFKDSQEERAKDDE